MSRRRKILFVCLWITGVFLFLLCVGEVTVRIMGYEPWAPIEKHSQVIPGGSLFIPDSAVGYQLRPGRFTVMLEGHLSFEAVHSPEHLRVIPSRTDTVERRQLWVLGCSFTYGWGVNDNKAWPALLTQGDSAFEVTNFATPGYSTAQSLLQLKAALDRGPRPDMVILGYAGFHNQRNVCSRHWKKALAGQPLMQGLSYPYVRLSAGDSLQWLKSDLHFESWWGMQHSALIHFLEIQTNLREEESLQAFEVTRKLILEMNAICKRENIPFIVAGVWHDASTIQMLEALVREGLPVVEIASPAGKEYQLMPDDLHPNEKAHEYMARKMDAYLHL